MARRLIEAGRPGSIIHVSSQVGLVGGANRSVYRASKHAIQSLTKAMAIDLAPHRMRVNAILPTFIKTAAFRDDALAKIKPGRVGQVEELMGAIACSPATPRPCGRDRPS